MKKVKDSEILWAKIRPDAKMPSKSKEDAGYDIYACFDDNFICIPTGCTKLIPTGLACALNEKYYLQLEERGSTGSKGIKRSAGVVDSGYRGEIFVALTNCSEKDVVISKLDNSDIGHFNENKTIIYPYNKAICQGIVHIVPNIKSREISYEELKKYKSERGDGKIGSSRK